MINKSWGYYKRKYFTDNGRKMHGLYKRRLRNYFKACKMDAINYTRWNWALNI